LPETSAYLEDVGAVSKALSQLGLAPVLVGGMALVILGSRRVTRDFDFVITKPNDRLEEVIAIFYDRGLELVSRLSGDGDVEATIDNRRIAAIRLKSDAPSSAYFFNPTTRLRIDLLFDFPLASAELMKAATTMKVQSQVLHVASERDLLRLKRIARAERSSPGDAQDIAFLEARRKRST
jgi:hypothetical protein